MKTKILSRIGQRTTPPCVRKPKTVHCALCTVHRLSASCIKFLTLLLGLVLSVNMWGADPETLYLEAFGDNGGSTTAISSYSNYTATQAMFSDGTATVKSHYSGSGTVGKSNYAATNLSNGYTGASGKSGIYHAGTANTEATIITISGIKIKDYESLQLSFGALGGSASHVVTATYQIDGGTTKALSLTNSTLSNSSWKLVSGSISDTGNSLTINIKHKPTKGWTIRLDDIKLTGTSAGPSTYTVNFAASPSGYGSVSQASLANVASGTSISANGSKLTVGSTTTITATPTTATAQYTYTFNNWTWSPTGSTITAATTATANFTRTENSYTVSYTDGGNVDYTNKPTSVKYSDAALTINANAKSGYSITGVSVTMGGSAMSTGDYDWEDGELMIMPTNFTGNIVVTFTTQLVQVCTNEITITKGTPSHGSFDLSQMGVVCIDDGNATVSVTNISPATHYHFKRITATNGSVDNDLKQVTISANTIINVEFEEDTKYTITFVDNLQHTASIPNTTDNKIVVYENETFTFPTIQDKTAATSGTCEQVHYHFMGWVLSTHEGTIAAGDIKTGTSAAVTAAATYYAVWAKEEL